MTKYIIDVPDKGKYRLGQTYIFANNGERFIASCNLADLTPYTEPDREAIENEVTEFWKTVKNMDTDSLDKIFGEMNFWAILNSMPYQEAKVKYDAWKGKEQKNEICIGDEVVIKGGFIPVVVLGFVGNSANVLYASGDLGQYPKDRLNKTGRHFNSVEKLLEEMRKSDG